MAAGVIYQTVTTTTGETLELGFYVNDTVSPTTWIPISLPVNASGAAAAFGSGANGATVQRVALATDSPGVIAEVAHDAADANGPLKVGTKAVAALSAQTLVAANDRSNAFSDLDGAVLVRHNTTLGDVVSGNASNTDGASTEVLAAAAAGIKHYLTTIILTNMHASSTIYVELKDGLTTKLTLPCPPGGSVFNLPVPLPGTAATAWNFDPSAATTTIYCSVIGFKSKV